MICIENYLFNISIFLIEFSYIKNKNAGKNRKKKIKLPAGI